MDQNFLDQLEQEVTEIREAGLYKSERTIVSPQGTVIRMQDGSEAINLCANNYLGLSGDPSVIETIVPSTMKLLGKNNWYLPTWLNWLPDVRVEGGDTSPTSSTPTPVQAD